MKKNTIIPMLILFACWLVVAGCAKRIVTQSSATSETTEGQTLKQDSATTEETKTDKTETIDTEKIIEQEIQDAKIASSDTGAILERSSKGNLIEEVKTLCSESIDPASSINFDFDSYSMKDNVKPHLKEVSSYLEGNTLKIYIEGHCDERGTDEYNLALGDRRASTTKDYLVSSGIASERIEIISCGEESPLCLEKIEECWSKNRRAHLVTLIGKQ